MGIRERLLSTVIATTLISASPSGAIAGGPCTQADLTGQWNMTYLTQNWCLIAISADGTIQTLKCDKINDRDHKTFPTPNVSGKLSVTSGCGITGQINWDVPGHRREHYQPMRSWIQVIGIPVYWKILARSLDASYRPGRRQRPHGIVFEAYTTQAVRETERPVHQEPSH